MSFLSDFERRISSVFGAAPQGYTEPFSFKKLAKRAAREMENETYVIDGVDTAPALYTVLVSATDDSLMRPLYEQITYEISTFVTQQAQKKGYSFVGEPLVRFMVDPSLKSGKFAVFAENVDSRTLTRLREEERAFLGNSSSVGGAAAVVHRTGTNDRSRRSSRPSRNAASVSAMPELKPIVQPASVPLSGTDAGLDVMPPDFGDPEPAPVASSSDSTPMPVPVITNTPIVNSSSAPQPVMVNVPKTQRRNVPLVDPLGSSPQEAAALDPYAAATAGAAAAAAAVSSQDVAQQRPITCMLIDRQTGRTFTGTAPTVVLGRERSQCDVVLRDPNVSRRHAQLTHDGRAWHIVDLNSTNGTLVNDVDIDECVLRSGDLITVGLVNLEFREN